MVRLSRQLFASPIPTEGKPVVKLHLLARIHKFTKARDSSGALLWAFHHFRLASDLLPKIKGLAKLVSEKTWSPTGLSDDFTCDGAELWRNR